MRDYSLAWELVYLRFGLVNTAADWSMDFAIDSLVANLAAAQIVVHVLGYQKEEEPID